MILEAIGKKGAILCGLLYALSVLLDQTGVYSLDKAYQGYLLSAAMICLGVYIIKKVQHIIFGIIILAAAADVLILAVRMHLV